MYTATTCSGSSGAPVIRFHSDSVHYISAGQFVHNGYWKEKLNKSMGCIRPPITYPYWKRLDSEVHTYLYHSLHKNRPFLDWFNTCFENK